VRSVRLAGRSTCEHRRRERCTIRVRVTGNDGTTSDWSAPTTVFAGHLADGEWTAQFVGLRSPEVEAQPALLRREFTIDEPVRSAVLYATARGATRRRSTVARSTTPK
jgi:alpha-L-rhamnosidase